MTATPSTPACNSSGIWLTVTPPMAKTGIRLRAVALGE